MKFEPALDKSALLKSLSRVYGYPAGELTFIPAGEVGCHYRLDCQDGRRFFVTLLSGGRLARLSRERLDFTLTLTRTLVDRDLFPFLAAPQRTKAGALFSSFQDQPLIVREYIEGRPLGEPWPPAPELLARLGALTALLHRSTPELGLEVPYVEEFNIPFKGALFKSLAQLEKVNDDHRPGQQALRDLIRPRVDRILELLARLQQLADQGRDLHPAMVLVHTDMHGGNLLQTPQGDVYVVDWEGAMLAPAEHDLFIFAGEGFSTLLAEYRRAAGNIRLHSDLFGFYFYRRNLEDTTDFLVRILHENTTHEEDQYDLELLLQDCLAGWPQLEAGIDAIREQL
ncbi:MAG: aminoglycoside phosphotransferase family protein [Anaerolineales bacterium]|nr:aminoglycoside phosphotransferase family protein [Anaerolineales bacterium]